MYRGLRYQHDLVQYLVGKSLAEYEGATLTGKLPPVATNAAGKISILGLRPWAVPSIPDDVDRSFIAPNVLPAAQVSFSDW